MYHGTNPSALRSRACITEALLTLLKKERYTDITIKNICREADLSRQTFYQIFESKDEVIEYLFSNLFSEFEEQCNYFLDMTLSKLCCSFFEFFQEHENFISILIDNNMAYLLEQEFEHYLPKIELFKKINDTEAYPDYSVCYMAGALSQILIHWYKNGMNIPVEVIGNMTENMASGKIFTLTTREEDSDNV